MTALCLAAPALADDAPLGSYQCKTVNTPVPVGVFTVTGPSTYDFTASSNTDFTPSPNDPSNGPGTYRMEGTFMILESGAFQEKWGNPSGELFPRDGTIMDLWFANNGGGILNCQFRG